MSLSQYCMFGWMLWFAATNALAAETSPFDDAVAVWHMADLDDAAGKNSQLEPGGNVEIGVALTDEDRKASLARGGDGKVAKCDGGWFSAEHGADGELNLTGEAMTMCIRLSDPSGKWDTSLFSKFGGHNRLVYNLYTVNLGSGMDLGFELGTDRTQGMYQVKVPIAQIGSGQWHDVIVRNNGKTLELIVDGPTGDMVTAGGALRQNLVEPCLIGAHSSNGQPQRPFRGLIDHAALWNRALGDDEAARLCGVKKLTRTEAIERRARYMAVTEAFFEVIDSKDPQVYGKAARAVREIMKADPHRPAYHFQGPLGWMNDPNGPIYFQGEYHVFFQHNPLSGRGSHDWNGICWGHAKSPDMVHWKDMPLAMVPDTPQDRNGVYSGNTVIDDRGIPTALYTGNVQGHKEAYTMMAASTDGMVTWKKRVVIDKPPYPGTPVNWDSQVWKDGESWYLLSGGAHEGAGTAVLWSSPNLIDWTYCSRIYETNRYGHFWELPYLIPLGDRHLLIIGVWPSRYWIGTYDKQMFTFTPDKQEAEILDYSTWYYSPNPHLFDDKGPDGSRRRIMMGWVLGGSPSKNVPYWEGLHSIPRVMTLEKGRLIQTPIPELEVLRDRHWQLRDQAITSPTPGLLSEIKGDVLEIMATFDRKETTAQRFGVHLRMSDDGKEKTTIYYEPASDTFGIDGDFSRRGGSPDKAPAGLAQDEPITMRIFLDRSVLEVYVNGRPITERLYPNPDSRSLDVFAEGGHVRLESIDVWQMKSSW